MRKILFLILSVSICGILHAQEANQYLFNRTPEMLKVESPNTASFNKYIDNPISLYNGTPDVSIPLYTLKDGSIELPITLRYNTSGIKVNEEASWVGLGWNLNVGGVITRQPVGGIDRQPIRGSETYNADKNFNAIMDIYDPDHNRKPTDFITTPWSNTMRKAFDWYLREPSMRLVLDEGRLSYDALERIVQTKTLNHLGGYEASYLSYNLVGELLAEKHIHHTANEQQSLTEQSVHTYDLMGRLLTTTHQLNDSTPQFLTNNTYDALGHLQKDSRNGHPSLQTECSYNIRSWLSELSGSLFQQTLHYNDGVGTPCYNGNISSTVWQNGMNQPKCGFKFEYDQLNRLRNAHYGEGSELSENPDRYTEQISAYDKMGNILGLIRYGKTSATEYGLVDNLSFTLNGNRLKSINDASTHSAYGEGIEFKDSCNQPVEYSYDANGKLTKDLNKKITDIQYNYLNLPCRIKFENGDSISYLYASDGIKLCAKHTINNCSTITDYCGNVIYENGIAKSLLTSAGYVSLADGKHHYYTCWRN